MFSQKSLLLQSPLQSQKSLLSLLSLCFYNHRLLSDTACTILRGALDNDNQIAIYIISIY